MSHQARRAAQWQRKRGAQRLDDTRPAAAVAPNVTADLGQVTVTTRATPGTRGAAACLHARGPPAPEPTPTTGGQVRCQVRECRQQGGQEGARGRQQTWVAAESQCSTAVPQCSLQPHPRQRVCTRSAEACVIGLGLADALSNSYPARHCIALLIKQMHPSIRWRPHTSVEIWASGLVLAPRIMGVISPPSVATATAMSTAPACAAQRRGVRGGSWPLPALQGEGCRENEPRPVRMHSCGAHNRCPYALTRASLHCRLLGGIPQRVGCRHLRQGKGCRLDDNVIDGNLQRVGGWEPSSSHQCG